MRTVLTVGEDIGFGGQLLNAYAVDAWRQSVASQDPKDAGVLPDMQVGQVDEEGWVEWRVLLSTLTEGNVTAVEKEFGATLPPLFRAYLLPRFQRLQPSSPGQLCQRFAQLELVMMTPIDALRSLPPDKKLEIVTQLWDDLAESGLPLTLPPEELA